MVCWQEIYMHIIEYYRCLILKKGIEYLVENCLLRHDAQDVAHFLYKGEGLNKTAIGK